MGSTLIDPARPYSVTFRPSPTGGYPQHPTSPSSSVSAAIRNVAHQPRCETQPRAVLVDITSTINLPSGSSVAKRNASFSLLPIGERAGTTRKRPLDTQLGARKVQRKRDAISLTREQARELASSLGRLSAPGPDSNEPQSEQQSAEVPDKSSVEVTRHADQESNLDSDVETVKGAVSTNSPFHTRALQSNLFLITRTDGHSFTCPPRPFVPASNL